MFFNTLGILLRNSSHKIYVVFDSRMEPIDEFKIIYPAFIGSVFNNGQSLIVSCENTLQFREISFSNRKMEPKVRMEMEQKGNTLSYDPGQNAIWNVHRSNVIEQFSLRYHKLVHRVRNTMHFSPEESLIHLIHFKNFSLLATKKYADREFFVHLHFYEKTGLFLRDKEWGPFSHELILEYDPGVDMAYLLLDNSLYRVHSDCTVQLHAVLDLDDRISKMVQWRQWLIILCQDSVHDTQMFYSFDLRSGLLVPVEYEAEKRISATNMSCSNDDHLFVQDYHLLYHYRLALSNEKEAIRLEKISEISLNPSSYEKIICLEGPVYISKNNSNLSFINLDKKCIIARMFLMTNDDWVLLPTESDYFYTTSIKHLCFIDKDGNHLEGKDLHPWYVKTYNNLEKTLEVIGLKKKKMDIDELKEMLSSLQKQDTLPLRLGYKAEIKETTGTI